jgi:hypothetical protein
MLSMAALLDMQNLEPYKYLTLLESCEMDA